MIAIATQITFETPQSKYTQFSEMCQAICYYEDLLYGVLGVAWSLLTFRRSCGSLPAKITTPRSIKFTHTSQRDRTLKYVFLAIYLTSTKTHFASLCPSFQCRTALETMATLVIK
jgi:hypothetical protein